jgi:hypothetical protein
MISSHPENQLVKLMRPDASMENGFGRDARATVRALPLHGHGLAAKSRKAGAKKSIRFCDPMPRRFIF